MQLESVHLDKADRVLRDVLTKSAPDGPVRAILMLTQSEGSRGLAPPRPSDFKSRTEYRKAAIGFQKAQFEQQHGPTVESLRDVGLKIDGGELLGALVVEGTAHQILDALELRGVEKALADRPISVEARRSVEP